MPTFTPIKWIPNSTTRIDSGRRVAGRRRFLGTYGPSTREVFAQWLGIPLTQAGLLIAGLGSEAFRVDVEGTRAWMLLRHLDVVHSNETRSPSGCCLRSISTSPTTIVKKLHPIGLQAGSFPSKSCTCRFAFNDTAQMKEGAFRFSRAYPTHRPSGDHVTAVIAPIGAVTFGSV
jgi:hypothetical protein